jgi:hypothetical protein
MADEPVKTAEDLRRELEEDYSQWVAAENIHHDGVLAYAKGQPVPHTNVQKWSYDRDNRVERPANWSEPGKKDRRRRGTSAGDETAVVNGDVVEAPAGENQEG